MLRFGDYTIRRLAPADAPGVVACAHEVYGDTYPTRAIYQPDEIIRRNLSGRWLSVVAIDPTGDVAAHSALEFSPFGPVAEIVMAMVQPRHQGRGLHKQLSRLLMSEGKTLGLVGHFSDYKADNPAPLDLPDHLPSHPCALTLSLWPSSVRHRGSAESDSTRRLSFLLYFRPYEPLLPRVTAHVLPQHAEIVANIYAQFVVECVSDAIGVLPVLPRPIDSARLHIEPLHDWQSIFIRVPFPDRETPNQLEQAHRDFLANPNLESAYLELPVSHPSTPEISRHAQRLGFFFSGVVPRYFAASDAFRLQCLKSDPQLSLLSITHSFGNKLLATIRDQSGW